MSASTRTLALALSVLGCSHASAVPASGPTTRQPLPAWKRSCLDYAQGPISIEYQDAPNGASVIYRAKDGGEGLRVRAEEIARLHNGSTSRAGSLHDLSSVPHTARVESVDRGVKLVLLVKTLRTSHLERMRWAVQQNVLVMQRQGCQASWEAL
jgi:hypothetical protein